VCLKSERSDAILPLVTTDPNSWNPRSPASLRGGSFSAHRHTNIGDQDQRLDVFVRYRRQVVDVINGASTFMPMCISGCDVTLWPCLWLTNDYDHR
jgi:hypothetical protein